MSQGRLAPGMAEKARKPGNLRGAGSTERKELRDRLRSKGQARRGDNPRAEEIGRGGGGP